MKSNIKHSSRVAAEHIHAANVKRLNGYNGTDEAEFATIQAAYADSRDALIQAEALYPTARENRLHSERRMRSARGLID